MAWAVAMAELDAFSAHALSAVTATAIATAIAIANRHR